MNQESRIKNQGGSLLLEAVIALTVIGSFVLVSALGVSTAVSTGRTGRERTVAAGLAEEALNAVEAIASQSYAKLYFPPDGTVANSPKGAGNNYKVVLSAGVWELQTGSETIGPLDGITYTRKLEIYNVERNGNSLTGEICQVSCPTPVHDSTTQKIIVRVEATGFKTFEAHRFVSARYGSKAWRQSDWSVGAGQANCANGPDDLTPQNCNSRYFSETTVNEGTTGELKL